MTYISIIVVCGVLVVFPYYFKSDLQDTLEFLSQIVAMGFLLVFLNQIITKCWKTQQTGIGLAELKTRCMGGLNHSKDVSDFIRRKLKLGTLKLQEQFIVLYLNTANEILGYYKHSIGSINGTIADDSML